MTSRYCSCLVLMLCILCTLHSANGGLYTAYNVTESPLNHSSAVDYCLSVNGGGIPNDFGNREEEFIQNCSRMLEIEENFWIQQDIGHEFPEEPLSWKCDFINESTCFIYDIAYKNRRWDQFKKSTWLWPPTFDGSYYLYILSTFDNSLAKYILEAKQLPDQDMCFIFYYRIYGQIGNLSVFDSSDQDKPIWSTETTNTKWTRKAVDIKSSTHKLYLIAQRNTGDPYGYFALDNVKLKYGECSFYSDFPSKGCEEVYYSKHGTIQSPNFPSPYEYVSDCTWIVKAKKGFGISLFIHTFDLKDRRNDKCVDYLEIKESHRAEQPEQYCGNELEGSSIFFNYTNVLRLTFHGSSWYKRGFSMTWKTVLRNCSSYNGREETAVYLPCESLLNAIICVSENESGHNECRRATEKSLIISQNDGLSDAGFAIGIGIGATLAILAAVLTVVIVMRRYRLKKRLGSISGTLCLKARKSKRNQQRKDGVHDPEYIPDCTDIPTERPRHTENDKSSNTSDYTEAATVASRYYHNVEGMTDTDDPYNHLNHLNEMTIRNRKEEYLRCNDLGTYDQLKITMNEDFRNDSDTYDHTGMRGIDTDYRNLPGGSTSNRNKDSKAKADTEDVYSYAKHVE